MSVLFAPDSCFADLEADRPECEDCVVSTLGVAAVAACGAKV